MAHRPKVCWQRWVGVFVCAWGSASAPAELAAAPDDPSAGLVVRFAGPSSCGDPTRLLDATRALLASGSKTPAVEVDATVTHTRPDQFTLHLRLHGDVTGERRLGARNCEEALQAGAVVIALAIDPDAVARAQQGDGSSEPSSAAASTTTPEPPTTTATTTTNANDDAATAAAFEASDPHDPVDSPWSSLAVHPFLGIAGRIGTGLKPAPGWGGQLELGLELGGVLVSASAYASPAVVVDDTAAGAVQWREFGAALRLCARFIDGQAVDLLGCGGASMAWLSAEALSLQSGELQRARLTSVIGELLLGVKLLPRVSLLAAAGLGVPTTEPRFVVGTPQRDVLVVFEPSWGVTGSLGLWLSWK